MWVGLKSRLWRCFMDQAIAFEGLITEVLLTKPAGFSNGCNGRVV